MHNHKATRWSYLPQPELVGNALRVVLFAVLRKDDPGAASRHIKFLVW
jgi:hypothetical protein